MAIDTETTSKDPHAARLVGISLAVAPWQGCYIPVGHNYAGVPEQLPLDEVLAVLKPWLESDAPQKVGQNLKYDMHVLANHGITLHGVVDDTIFMTRAYSRLLYGKTQHYRESRFMQEIDDKLLQKEGETISDSYYSSSFYSEKPSYNRGSSATGGGLFDRYNPLMIDNSFSIYI